MSFDEEAEGKLDEERKQLCREKIELSKSVDKFEAMYIFKIFVINNF